MITTFFLLRDLILQLLDFSVLFLSPPSVFAEVAPSLVHRLTQHWIYGKIVTFLISSSFPLDAFFLLGRAFRRFLFLRNGWTSLAPVDHQSPFFV